MIKIFNLIDILTKNFITRCYCELYNELEKNGQNFNKLEYILSRPLMVRKRFIKNIEHYLRLQDKDVRSRMQKVSTVYSLDRLKDIIILYGIQLINHLLISTMDIKKYDSHFKIVSRFIFAHMHGTINHDFLRRLL